MGETGGTTQSIRTVKPPAQSRFTIPREDSLILFTLGDDVAAGFFIPGESDMTMLARVLNQITK